MENRFRKMQLWTTLLFCCLFGLVQQSTAQIDFTFVYNGPDTINVGADCTTPLDWGAPQSVSVTCNNPGCEIITFELFNISGGYSQGDSVGSGENVVITYFAEDDSGNTAFFGFRIYFVDRTPPVFDPNNVPADASYDCITDVPPPPPNNMVIANDNCPAPGGTPDEVTVTYDGEVNTPATCAGGAIMRTWTATDASGNTSQYTQTININPDTDPPVFGNNVGNTTEDCSTHNYSAWLATVRADIQATDNGCDGVTITDNAPADFMASCTVVTVTFTATDACGLTATTDIVYTIEDNEGPVITPPASTDVTLDCDATPDPITTIQNYADNLTATDNCGMVTWTNNFNGPGDLNNSCGGNTGSVMVTFTASDECGNDSTIDINFTIEDNDPPTITNPAMDMLMVECDNTVDTQLQNWLNNSAGATATDDCTDDTQITTTFILNGNPATDMDIQIALRNSLGAGCGGSVTVTFALTDACGNPTNTTADFSVTDTADPIWTTNPTNLTIECDGSNDPNNAIRAWSNNNGGGAATDGCQMPTITNDYLPIVFSCGTTGMASVTFTATDGCGNTATQMVTVTIEDTTAPVWDTDPMNMTVSCDAANNQAAYDAWRANVGGGMVNDACGTVTITSTNTPLSDECGSTGMATVTFTATDECGNNMADRTATFTIEDTTLPVWTADPQGLTVECDGPTDPAVLIQNWLDNSGNGTATDNCSATQIDNNYGNTPDPCGATNAVVVTFTASDECGNMATRTATLTINDNNPPVWDMDPEPLVLECNENTDIDGLIQTWLTNNGNGQASDQCSGNVTYENNYTGLTAGCGNTGSATVTFIARDACGNEAPRTISINVNDTMEPQLNTPAANQTVDCDDPNGISLADWLASHGGAMATDACTPLTDANWTENITNNTPGCGTTFSQTVEFTVTDACGNDRTTTATYTLVDNTPPTVAPMASNLTETCGGGNDQSILNNWINNIGGAMATDNCGNATWTTFSYTSAGGNGNNIALGDIANYPQATANDCTFGLQVIWTVEDECGMATTTSASFTIIDNEPPVFTNTPANTAAECDNIPPAGMPTVMDNCDNNPSIVLTEVTTAGACPNDYLITRTWRATDACGNTATTAQVITVMDNMPPVFNNQPNNITVDCDGIPDPVMVTATDACDPNPMVDFDENLIDGICDFTYTLTRTWTATDACGNTSEFTQTISVEDNEAPNFVGPTNITVSCEQGTDPMSTGAPAAVTDNCDPNPMFSSADMVTAGSCPNEFSIVRTWTAQDACGNVSVPFIQMINVIDDNGPAVTTAAMDEMIPCADDANANLAFQNWVNNHGGAVAMDNCSANDDLTWNAWVPGSYNINDPSTFPGQAVGSLDAATCPSGMNNAYRFEAVDFVVFDECDNVSVTNATFSVEDNQPPVFDNCPNEVVVPAALGTCEATVTLPIPVISETCSGAMSPVSIIVNEPISSNDPGNELMVVNPVTLNFTGLPTPPALAGDPVVIDITLNQVDGEVNTEIFNILGENNTPLGSTNNTPTQCGNITTQVIIPVATFNIWAGDGTLTITLLPNVPAGQDASFAINDICPLGGGGSSVTAALNYNITTPQGLMYAYSINNGPRIIVSPIQPITQNFNVGEYDITYYATDCAGNEGTCNFPLRVTDEEAPMISCPGDIVQSVGPLQDCDDGVEITLPLPTFIDDNCPYPVVTQVQPSIPAEQFITFSRDPNYLEYIADDKTITFTGLAANAVGNSVDLSVRIEGDADNPEAFYSIFGEDGSLLGTTEVGQPNVTILIPGDCSVNPPVLPLVVTQIEIPTALYNSYVGDGDLILNLESNDVFAAPAPGGNSDGINPACTPFTPGTPDGQSDGRSRISLQLDVEKATPYYFTIGATIIPATTMQQPAIAPTISFAAGITEVYYVINDPNGNVDSCSFTVTIEDLVDPIANCEPATIFVNPSGVDPYELQPFEINNGSFDNCEIATFEVFPNTFTCNQAGQTIDVTLVVTDFAGNTDSCETIVRIEVESPEPTYSVGLCGNDTLSLFANSPFAQGNVVYTYQWTGPNGFMSNEENPTIPGATSDESGSYTVTIVGLTSCTSTGSVQVTINDTPNVPVIAASDNDICENEELVLTTQLYAGNNVNYSWYAGIFPGGTFIATTTLPTFTVLPPQVTNTYFVIVEVDGCASEASLFTLVNSTQAPVAAVNDPLLEVCEGNDIILGSPTTGNGFVYSWTGPNGFTSSSQNPMAIAGSSLTAGDYTLIVSNNGCESIPVTTMVVVNPTPNKPILSVNNGTACAGDDVVFSTNITNGTVYTWTTPNFGMITTDTNILVLNNIDLANGGNYSVLVSNNGCDSEGSDRISLFVEPLPMVTAANDGPSCEDGNVQLSATTIANASYSWSGPNGFTSVNQNPIVPAVAGDYTVTVTSSSGCSNTATTELVVSGSPIITAIRNTGEDCVTGADDIMLIATVFPSNPDNTYQWTGPNFSSVAVSPTLPNGTAADNGSYTLVVTNASGCQSDPITTVVNVQDAPGTPVLSGSSTICEGEPLTLTTSGYTGSMITYNWETPMGILTTPVPSLTIFPTTASNSGSYMLSVTVDGCTSNVSAVVQVNIIEAPAFPVITAPSTVCAGTSLQLSTEMVPGAIYEWSGPGGFNPPNIHNPIVFGVSETNEGTYTVRIVLDGCESETSDPINVVVNDSPAPPSIIDNTAVCISEENAMATLSIIPGTATAGATYTWFNAGTNELLFGPSSSLNFTLEDFTGFTDGTYEFYVVATASGCSSINSVPTSIEFNTIPENNAFAGDDIQICGGQSVTLEATVPTIGTGQWTQTSGPGVTIANPTDANTVVSGLADDQSYAFLWSLSNGACGAYSSDEVQVSVNMEGMSADAGDNIEGCDQNDIMLSAVAASNNNLGTWTQSTDQAAQGVTIEDPNDPNTAILGASAGVNYLFTWTLSNPGCGDFATDQVSVTIIENGGVAFAGIDIQECGDGTIILEATANGNGTWTTNEPDVVIISPNSATTVVRDIEPGVYTFTWTVDAGICGVTTDDVIVTYDDAPTANDDVASADFNERVMINVSENDITPDDIVYTITSQPTNGSVLIIGDGTMEYAPNNAFAGTDEFVYMICNINCSEECSEATVTVVVGENAPCDIPTIITPNDDGTNDNFVIPCLATDEYPDNLVTIYNQWGDEVFRAENYQNNWGGQYNGEDLPVSTYFFVVDFKNGQEPQSGFLILER